jgi:amino acid transporter
VAAVLIWLITWLQVRGARLAGLTTAWMSVVMMAPLVLMTIVGFYNWIRGGATIALPMLPEGESWIGAFSVGLFVVMWNYMGWELPTAAGDEIVNPRKTYPRAMALVLVAAILTYAGPALAGLYGGAGQDGRHQVWGIEEYEDGEGIGVVLEEYGVTGEQMDAWGVDPASPVGWEFPDVGQRLGEVLAGPESPWPRVLGITITLAAVLSMIGLFIGNSLGGSRVPFALAEDGMMPRWLVHVHPRYGTPWVAILFCGVIFSIFSLNAFAFLVVVDVFLNVLVLLGCFLALWRLRVTKPDVPRQKIPGGTLGLLLVTLGPFIIFFLAVYSQIVEEGFNSLWLALVAIVIGAVLYFPIKRRIKPGIPDVNPFEASPEEA